MVVPKRSGHGWGLVRCGMGCKHRESVRLLVKGKRGKGGFPEPELGTGKWQFWRW